MTEAEIKAYELIEKFAPKCSGNSQSILNKKLAKQCAAICVNEILTAYDLFFMVPVKEIKFYKDVLTEIENTKE